MRTAGCVSPRSGGGASAAPDRTATSRTHHERYLEAQLVDSAVKGETAANLNLIKMNKMMDEAEIPDETAKTKKENSNEK